MKINEQSLECLIKIEPENPKADEDLKKWKEKLANGVKDGTHKYTVKNTFKVFGDLDKIASTIEKKSMKL
jgi:hypothetical protein